MKRSEVKGSFVPIGTRGQTGAGLWRGRLRERAHWRDLITALRRTGRRGLRVTSRPGALEAEG